MPNVPTSEEHPVAAVRGRFHGICAALVSRRVLPAWVGCSVIAIVVALRTLTPAPFIASQISVFDALQRIAPRAYVQAPVRVIDIDEESLKRVGQWPWSRDVLAVLTERITALGAAAIAFDFVFPEPDRTSPSMLIEKWAAIPGFPAVSSPPRALPDYDRRFADAIAAGPVILAMGLIGSEQPGVPMEKAGIALIGADPARSLTQFPGAVINLPMLEAAAKGIGSFSITGEDGETIRRVPLIARYQDRIVPSLSLEALRVAQGADTIGVRRDKDASADSPLRIKVGDIIVPADADGSLRMYFTGPVSERAIPAWQIISAGQEPRLEGLIAGHIVLIGTSATGLSDLRPTPLNPFEPSVNIHAQAIEQMLLGAFLDRPAWFAGAEVTAAVALAGGLVFICAFQGVGLSLGALFATLAGALAATWYGYSSRQLLGDPTLVCVTAVPAVLAATLTRYFLVEREARALKRAFSQYLAPALVDQVVRNLGHLRMGGEAREISCLFTDLDGFTDFVEHARTDELVAILNAYLDALCSIAMDHGGTVVKLIGDAVHVIFNAPVDQTDHAARAVACARAMDAFAVQFSGEQRGKHIPFGSTRIGVNTGYAIVGNFGGNRRFDYSAYGDTINTAARLENANKILGTRICISRSTVAQCSAGGFRPIGSLVLKGKTEPVDVYEPIEGTASDPACYRFGAVVASQSSFGLRGRFRRRAQADVGQRRDSSGRSDRTAHGK
ncbi:MAG TPA: adenylate/guanylate cyclase domain-containing protein [Xanthobacteraceae bacterium]